MLDMRRLGTHLESIEKGIELANQFHWFLEVVEIQGKWFVRSGESVIFGTDNREAVDAFLYGLGLAYAVIPSDLFEYLVKETDNYK